MSVGFRTNFPKRSNTNFTVKNMADNNKTVRVFSYPILNRDTRDLLKIPEVSEADIRHSLLKGDLRIKLETGELIVVSSNIDLLQFSIDQKAFLESVGITEGLEVTGTGGLVEIPFLFKENATVSGIVNGLNRTFTTSDKFLDGSFQNNSFSISVFHNGKRLVKDEDFTIAESGGLGSGYDTINFISFTPNLSSIIRVFYFVEAP